MGIRIPDLQHGGKRRKRGGRRELGGKEREIKENREIRWMRRNSLKESVCLEYLLELEHRRGKRGEV